MVSLTLYINNLDQTDSCANK